MIRISDVGKSYLLARFVGWHYGSVRGAGSVSKHVWYDADRKIVYRGMFCSTAGYLPLNLYHLKNECLANRVIVLVLILVGDDVRFRNCPPDVHSLLDLSYEVFRSRGRLL